VLLFNPKSIKTNFFITEISSVTPLHISLPEIKKSFMLQLSKIQKQIFLGFIALSSFSLISCSPPKDLEFREVKNIKIDKLGFTAATLKVDLLYYNPNKVGFELNQTDVDIFVNNTLLGHSFQKVQIKIPSRQLFTLPLNIELDMKNLLKNSLTSLLNKEVTLRIKGSVRAGKAGFYKVIPLDYSTVQKIPFL
jgi:LEA14-like dessication related protein